MLVAGGVLGFVGAASLVIGGGLLWRRFGSTVGSSGNARFASKSLELLTVGSGLFSAVSLVASYLGFYKLTIPTVELEVHLEMDKTITVCTETSQSADSRQLHMQSTKTALPEKPMKYTVVRREVRPCGFVGACLIAKRAFLEVYQHGRMPDIDLYSRFVSVQTGHYSLSLYQELTGTHIVNGASSLEQCYDRMDNLARRMTSIMFDKRVPLLSGQSRELETVYLARLEITNLFERSLVFRLPL